jgi:hypothetical protein
MNNNEKSIAYAFIANGVQIYLNENEPFIVSKLVCAECGDAWYMNLTECFLCGAINPFLYQCSSCKTFQSITKSSNQCSKCRSNKLYMVCPNPKCVSNTNKDLFSSANSYGGVFNKESGLLIAQQYCLTCGSKHHIYKNHSIYVRVSNKKEINFNDLEINPDGISNNSYLIVKYKPNSSTLYYELFNINDVINKRVILKNLKDNFKNIVAELYPIRLK